MARITAWTDEKLDRELAFATASVGDDERAARWLAQLRAEHRRRQVAVTLTRPGAKRSRILKRFSTVRQAERYIAQRERIDPTGVHRGDYGIDASEKADAAYQRLRNRGGSR